MIFPSNKKLRRIIRRQEGCPLTIQEPLRKEYNSAEDLFRTCRAISATEIEGLSEIEAKKAKALIAYNFEVLVGEERDVFITQIEPFLETSGNKNVVWERNHHHINRALLNHLTATNSLPSVTTLHKKTGLSRLTIYKHLAKMDTDEFLKEQNQKLKSLYGEVMGAVCKEALNGNIQAAKLFVEVLQLRNSYSAATIITNQQNNVNINREKNEKES